MAFGATTVAKLQAVLDANTRAFDQKMKASDRTVTKMGTATKMAAKVAGVALIGLGVAAVKATRDASHLNEMITATETVFGSSAEQVLEWSKNTSDAFSQADFLGAAKSFAVFAQQAGLGETATAKFSNTLIEAAGNLASFHDANPADVLADLRSGLAGETEPLRKYGILVDEASLAQEGMKLGLIESGEALTAREKIIARQSLILGQMGAAQGDWNRTRDSAANRERTAIANAKDLSAQLGQALLPAYQKILEVALQLVGVMGKHKTATKAVIIALAGLAAALVVATAAQTAMNLAVLANPYVAAAVAVVALAGAITFLVVKVDFFRKHWQLLMLALGIFPVLVATVVKAVIRNFDTLKGWFNAVKEAASVAFSAIRVYIGTLIGPLLTVIGLVQDAIGFFRDLAGASGSNIGSSLGAAAGAGHRPPEGATGALVRRPTFALIGESGPEAVVPLGRTRGNSPLAAMGMAGGVTNNFYIGGSVIAERDLHSLIRRLQEEHHKRGGS